MASLTTTAMQQHALVENPKCPQISRSPDHWSKLTQVGSLLFLAETAAPAESKTKLARKKERAEENRTNRANGREPRTGESRGRGQLEG